MIVSAQVVDLRQLPIFVVQKNCFTSRTVFSIHYFPLGREPIRFIFHHTSLFLEILVFLKGGNGFWYIWWTSQRFGHYGAEGQAEGKPHWIGEQDSSIMLSFVD